MKTSDVIDLETGVGWSVAGLGLGQQLQMIEPRKRVTSSIYRTTTKTSDVIEIRDLGRRHRHYVADRSRQLVGGCGDQSRSSASRWRPELFHRVTGRQRPARRTVHYAAVTCQ